MSYVTGKSTLGPRGRGAVSIVRATPAMARASRAALGITTDEAVDVVKSEGATAQAPQPSGRDLLWLAGLGLAAWVLIGGGGVR